MAITASGRFRKVMMKGLVKKYGMYRGQGKITIDDKEIVVEGSHVKSFGARLGIAIFTILAALLIFKSEPGGAFILSGIPIYLLVEHVFLTKENVRIQRDEFKKFAFDPKNQLVGIEFIGPKWTSPAIMMTVQHNEVVEALSQFVAVKENRAAAAHRQAEAGVKTTVQEKPLEPASVAALEAETASVAILHAEGKSMTGGATQAWKITLSATHAVFKQFNSSIEITVPHQKVISFLSLTNSAIAGHNVIVHQGPVKHRMFLNQQDMNRFGEWLGTENIKHLSERSGGLQFASVIQLAIFITFGIGVIKAIKFGRLSGIYEALTDPYVFGGALVLSLILHTAKWFRLTRERKINA